MWDSTRDPRLQAGVIHAFSSPEPGSAPRGGCSMNTVRGEHLQARSHTPRHNRAPREMQLQWNRQGEPTACSLQWIQQAEYKYTAPLFLPVQAIAAADGFSPAEAKASQVHPSAVFTHHECESPAGAPSAAGISVFQLYFSALPKGHHLCVCTSKLQQAQ